MSDWIEWREKWKSDGEDQRRKRWGWESGEKKQRERESDEDEWDEKIDLDEKYNACASMEMEINWME